MYSQEVHERVCTLSVHGQPCIKCSTQANKTSINGLIFSLHWLTGMKACLWKIHTYTGLIFPASGLSLLFCSVPGPSIPWSSRRPTDCTGSLWQLVWICPYQCSVPRCPGPSSSQISDLLVSPKLAGTHGCSNSWLPSLIYTCQLVQLGVCQRSPADTVTHAASLPFLALGFSSKYILCLLQSQNVPCHVIMSPIPCNPLLQSAGWSRESLSSGLPHRLGIALACWAAGFWQPWEQPGRGLSFLLGLLGFLCLMLFICALCVCGEEPLIPQCNTTFFLPLKSQETGHCTIASTAEGYSLLILIQS